MEIVIHAQSTKAAVYHVLNPNTSSDWEVILEGLKMAGLQFDIVSREEWLDRLAKSDPDAASNPTIKLLVSGYGDARVLYQLFTITRDTIVIVSPTLVNPRR